MRDNSWLIEKLHGQIYEQNKTIKEHDERIHEFTVAVGLVCEGWNIPDGARKILETVLFK